MHPIIVISKCQKRRSENGEIRFLFNFQGHLHGNCIKKIELVGGLEDKIKEGEEYVIYMNIHSINSGVVMGEIINVKILKNFYWN